MAEFIDISLNVAGWIVAGLVTLGGILLAHRVQEKARLRQEDRAGLYEPLRREMAGILERKYVVKSGYTAWTPSDEFRVLRERGHLHPKRHDSLRGDIDALLKLQDDLNKTYSAFYDARQAAIQAVFVLTDYAGEGGERGKLVKIFGQDFQDHQLMESLAAANKEAWVARFNERFDEAANRLGKPTKLLASPPELYEKASYSVDSARRDFVKDSDAFFRQAGRIMSGLDAAIEAGSRYRPIEPKAERGSRRR